MDVQVMHGLRANVLCFLGQEDDIVFQPAEYLSTYLQKMKKQRISTKEAIILRFIENHYNGDALKKFMDMSPRLDKNDLQFLRFLTSNEPTFNQRLNNHRETVDAILDLKSMKKSFSQVIPILQDYAERSSFLSRDSVALVTANICAKALEDYVLSSRSQCGQKSCILLELKMQNELAELTGVVKKLVTMNKFQIDSFKQKYFEMNFIPLQVLWHFHCMDLVPFTSYIYHNANRKEVIDHIKSSMVNLLCSLCGIYCPGPENASGTNEQMMDVEEIITAGTNQNNTENFVILGMKDEEDGLLQLKQCIASDLISLLLCVAQVSSSSSAGIKSCAKNCDGILENIIDRAMNNILSASLNSAPEVKIPHNHKDYLSLLLEVPTLSADILETFLNSHLVTTLSYKPHVDVYTAISKQDAWTYKKSPAILTSIIRSMLVGLRAESVVVLKNILQKGDVNWKLALVCVSTYVNCIPEGGSHMKGLVDWLLSKAFLNCNRSLLIASFLIARQCCAEDCAPWFPNYMSWFGTAFGHESSWASQQSFEFFIQFLTEVVPYEPPACLRVHIDKPPACPQSSFFLLGDYVTLAKTRLKDFNEKIEFGVFGPGLTTEQDIEHALTHFETHNGEIAQTVLSACLFHRQHFEQNFLRKLLAPRVIPDTPDIKAKFINKLHSMGKISHSVYTKYQETCRAEARIFQG